MGGGGPSPLGPSVPDLIVRLACIARTVLAALFVLGVGTRIAGVGLGIVGLALLTNDVFASSHTFRLLYGSAIVLAMTDSSAIWALRRRVDDEPGIGLVRAWLVSIYAWAGIAKLTPGWLSGLVLSLDLRDGVLRDEVVEALLADADTRTFLALAVVVLEAGLAAALSMRRTRAAALLVAVVAQIAFQVVASPDIFGLVVVVLCGVLWIADHDVVRPEAADPATRARTEPAVVAERPL